MADEKHNREENEALHKEEHIDLDELTEQSAPANEADLSWLDELDDDEDGDDLDDEDKDGEDEKDIDLDAMIDEILNHIDPNDWEDWKEQPAREVSLPTPPAAATPQQPTPADDVPTGKARKKQRRSLPTNIAEGVIYVGGILLISFILATIGWRWAGDVLALNKEPVTASVTITEGESLGDVTAELKEKGLVKYGYLFQLFASFTHKAEKITAGSYELSTVMDYSALLNNISSTSAYRETVTVTIPEGYTVEEIFKLMENKGVCSYDDLLKTAQKETFDFDFLKDVKTKEEKRLEGYLFPDTYEFYKNHNAKNALGKLIDAFADRIDEDAFASSKAKSMGYSMKDVVIIASLIEKETDGTDQRDIASVIYNRLQKPGETVGLLQIDASLLYGLPDHTGAITNADKAVDTPYNLYLHKGLPPTAIANPGSAALKAAMDPNDTDYYYYALGTDGKHHFSKTLSEHNAFVGSSSYGG